MKYIESKKKYTVISIGVGIIALLIILGIWILHQEHIKREIGLLGIIYAVDGEVSQGVVNRFMQPGEAEEYYGQGEMVLETSGYGLSGRKLLNANFPTVVAVLIALMVCVVVFLCAYLIHVVRTNRKYQEAMLEWMEGSAEKNFLIYDETRTLVEKIEEVHRLDKEKEALLLKEKEIVLRFMEDVSHQLKTPLAVLRIYCEKEMNETPELTDKMKNCLIQIDKMSVMIRNLLQTGRLESGKVQMDFGKVHLEEFVEILLYDLEEMALKKEIQLEFEEYEEQIWYFDLNWMKQAVENIIKNGLEHGSKGTTLRVHFSREFKDCCIRISNIGRHIPEEKLQSMFERFAITDENKEGTGLGLSIAKLIVQSHFGTIEAKNTKNDSVLFEIIFPDFNGKEPYDGY